jgi:RNA polymerase sigma-70 factor, ECF subfamily
VNTQLARLPLSESFCLERDFGTWVAELITRLRSSLVRAAIDEGLTAHEALDAVQDACVTFIEHTEWRELDRTTNAAAHVLTTVVRNHARNVRRRRSRKDESMASLTPEEAVDQAQRQLDELLIEAEAHLQISCCVQTLKAKHRAVVTARLFEGLPGREVAKQLGLSPGNVAVLLHRALEELRTCLAASREVFANEASSN